MSLMVHQIMLKIQQNVSPVYTVQESSTAHKRNAARRNKRICEYTPNTFSQLPPSLLFPPNYSVGILNPFQPYITAHGATFCQLPTGNRLGSNGAPRFDHSYVFYGENNRKEVDHQSFANWQKSMRSCNGAGDECLPEIESHGFKKMYQKLDLSLHL